MQVGVPQGSILGPLLFLIYVNDLPSTVNSCDISLYADDTVLFCSAKSAIELEQKLNSDLLNLSHWFAACQPSYFKHLKMQIYGVRKQCQIN